jgi:hypothetical protein
VTFFVGGGVTFHNHIKLNAKDSSATARSARCALLRDTVPDQGEG